MQRLAGVFSGEGPFTLRLLLQPAVAAFFGIRYGLQDAAAGRSLFFWTALRDAENRKALVREAWSHVSKVFLAAVIIDCVFQYVVYHWIYPLQAFIMACLLAVVPYLIFRGLLNRMARSRMRVKS